MIKHCNMLPLVIESRNTRPIGHHNFHPEVLNLLKTKIQVSIYVSEDLKLKSSFP